VMYLWDMKCRQGGENVLYVSNYLIQYSAGKIHPESQWHSERNAVCTLQ
jgi:hypothetical protein